MCVIAFAYTREGLTSSESRATSLNNEVTLPRSIDNVDSFATLIINNSRLHIIDFSSRLTTIELDAADAEYPASPFNVEGPRRVCKNDVGDKGRGLSGYLKRACS